MRDYVFTPIRVGDSHTFDLAVTDGGAAVDLTGATITAGARSRAGAYVAAATAVVTVSGQQRARVHFAPGALPSSDVWEIAARIALAGEVQTALTARLTVEGSILP